MQLHFGDFLYFLHIIYNLGKKLKGSLAEIALLPLTLLAIMRSTLPSALCRLDVIPYGAADRIYIFAGACQIFIGDIQAHVAILSHYFGYN